MGRSTISNIIKEVTKALWEELQPTCMAPPTADQWKDIIKQFWLKWNFPNCCGSIDGRHVPIQCPKNSGSDYYNYKQTFSIVLMAACDASYCFTMVDVGGLGRNSDGGVLKNSVFGQKLFNNDLGIPQFSPLPGLAELFPNVFVGDEAFPLRENLMRPFPGKGLCERRRIFNYRLSRARRVIENSFGILVARWRCLRVRMCLLPTTCDYVILACCCLHNFLQRNNRREPEAQQYCPPSFVDREDADGNIILGSWRTEVPPELMAFNERVGTNNASAAAKRARDRLALYFTQAEGSVPWQVAHVNRDV